MFVYWGFEPITDVAVRAVEPDLGLGRRRTIAPHQPTRSSNGSPIDAGAIRHPDWTAEQHAQSIKHDIDAALDRGYRVVISDVWTWSADELAGQLGGLSAADRAPAIHAMLHDNYEATPVLSDADCRHLLRAAPPLA